MADFVERVKEITNGHGADVILCFIGGEYTARNVEALANYGRLVQIGLRQGREVTFDWKVLMNKWAMMTGGHLRPRSIQEKGELRDALNAHVVPLWCDGSLPMPEVRATKKCIDARKRVARLTQCLAGPESVHVSGGGQGARNDGGRGGHQQGGAPVQNVKLNVKRA